MPHDAHILPWDGKPASTAIEHFPDGMDRDDGLPDRWTRAADERKFAAIGEARNRRRRSHPERAARIPDLPGIVGSRNVLIHGLDSVMPPRFRARVREYVPVDLPIPCSEGQAPPGSPS